MSYVFDPYECCPLPPDTPCWLLKSLIVTHNPHVLFHIYAYIYMYPYSPQSLDISYTEVEGLGGLYQACPNLTSLNVSSCRYCIKATSLF